ncbi:MAG: hypothetical protein ACO1SX_10825 [Actinomycetota bacterium]
MWVSSTALYPRVAGRQAVSLWYRVGREGTVVVTQTAAVRGADPGEYLRWVNGNGYLYAVQPDGSLLQFGTRAGRADFSLIGVKVTRADLEELSKALITSAVAR